MQLEDSPSLVMLQLEQMRDDPTDIVTPGDVFTAIFDFRTPVPMEAGQRFSMINAERTVAIGVVSAILAPDHN
jgi:translation elongation factor EF-Tu-like GTPase